MHYVKDLVRPDIKHRLRHSKLPCRESRGRAPVRLGEASEWHRVMECDQSLVEKKVEEDVVLLQEADEDEDDKASQMQEEKDQSVLPANLQWNGKGKRKRGRPRKTCVGRSFLSIKLICTL